MGLLWEYLVESSCSWILASNGLHPDVAPWSQALRLWLLELLTVHLILQNFAREVRSLHAGSSQFNIHDLLVYKPPAAMLIPQQAILSWNQGLPLLQVMSTTNSAGGTSLHGI
jgi:hypothetical protein